MCGEVRTNLCPNTSNIYADVSTPGILTFWWVTGIAERETGAGEDSILTLGV